MTLRMVTWNVFYCKDFEKILNNIKTHSDFTNIDLFIFQEVSVHDSVEDTKRIAEALGKDFSYYQETAQVRKNFPQANGFIWNTKKITVKKKEVVFLPNFLEATIGTPEKTLKQFMRREKRNAVMIEGMIADKTFRVYGGHFDVIGFDLKTQQLKHLLEDSLKRGNVDLTCIAGDLNTFKVIKRPRWRSLQAVIDEHEFIDITTEIKWSFHHTTFKYKQKTDAIFIKQCKNLTYSSWSQNISGSDHIPIFANINL